MADIEDITTEDILLDGEDEKDKVQLSFNISKEQNERLLQLAKVHSRTKASMIRAMIDIFHKQEFKKK